MEEYPLIADLALILIAAGCTSIVCKITKLPVIVGYLLAGLLAGPKVSLLPTVTDNASIHTWSEIGVIFLLFALGLEFNFKSLLKVGKTGAITACAILFAVMLAAFGLGAILNWSLTQSIFMGGMLAISSTMVAVKAFEELKLKGEPFTHIVYGVEVVEDIVAILLMVILPMLALSQSESLAQEVTKSIMRVVFFMSIWFLGGIFIVPTILRKLKKYLNDELLLIIALALCLGMVMLADHSGLSTALGAFVIGAILGTTPEAHHIEGLMRPIKNLFGAIFFVSVGMMADPSVILDHWGTILLCLSIVIVIQPIAAAASIMLTGKSISDSVHAGLSFGNIGEFSFIIANLGIAHHILADYLYPVVIVVCVITTITMPNMLKLADPITNKLTAVLPKSLATRGETEAQTAQPKSPNRRSVLIKQFLFETFILSVLTIGIIALFVGFIEPFAVPRLEALLSTPTQSLTTTWPALANALLIQENTSFKISQFIVYATMMVCMIPFLSALIIRKSNMQRAFFVVLLKGGQNHLLFILRTVRIFLVAAFIVYVITNHFPFNWILKLCMAAVMFSATFFFKGAFSNYLRLERQFLFNYNEIELAEQEASRDRSADELGSLTDIREGAWLSENLSVAHLRVDEDTPFLNKTLRELNLRAELELFIIRIEHGDEALNIPAGDTVIHLDDTIYIVGKADALRALTRAPFNISKNKLYIESMSRFTKNLDDRKLDEAPLRCLTIPIGPESGFANKTLRESGIGVKSKCLVIGIEIGERVEMSPKADTTFTPGCLVWVVGEPSALSHLLEANIA
ncbi:MAG: cation:proton antiporter [Proteobacteria bacterium]|nr:cation:proton antiporter [Pseudomonadota bacterium]